MSKVQMRGKAKYGFREFMIDDAYKYLKADVHSISVAASRFAKRHGWKLRTKTIGKDVIVWRVA